mmetsp:Transcript_793/g.997  ORF Transcript_793/g.997 Transcript_793/m.997 type:complete len:232 (+) Transcript_793:488-1183(+)
MCTPASVCVDDNLPASEPSISHRSSNYKSARRVQVIQGVRIQKFLWNGIVDNMVLEVRPYFFVGNIFGVLNRNYNSVDTNRCDFAPFVFVFNSYLGFSIRSHPGASSIVPHLSHSFAKSGSKHVCKGHHLRGFVGGIAEHKSLISSSHVLHRFPNVYTLCDVGALLFQSNQNITGFGIKPKGRVVESNSVHDPSNGFLVINNGTGGYLTKNHHHTSFGGCLTSYFAVWVLS